MRVIFTLVIFILSWNLGVSQDTIQECNGDWKTVVYKGDTVTIDCDRLVLMNPETFAMYYHDSKDLEALREEVPEWTETIDSLHKAHEENKLELDSVAKLRHEQVMLERESKEAVVDDLIRSERNNRILARKNKRLKLFSVGSSSLSVILLLILL